MPRHPDICPDIRGVRASVFSTIAHRLQSYEGEKFPFHVGDTWMDPPEGCRAEQLRDEGTVRLNRYSAPQGIPALREAIATRVGRRSGLEAMPRQILVTAGATGGLDAVCGAVLDPGDEVLVLAPFWPLIDGVVRSNRGRPVPVPFLGEVESAEAAVAAVERHRTERTVALYVSTPNNPTGRVIPRTRLEALAGWAAEHDLWIFSDEVYEDYVYEGTHAYMRPLAPERTFSVHSFSKAFGMAGYRCGYVVGPDEVMADLAKVSTHAFYSAPTPSQVAALVALRGSGDAWVADARESYRAVGRAAADRLGVPAPEGSTFLFLDVSERIGEGGLGEFLERAVARGVCLAPGPSFGPYPHHVRLCFTAQPPEEVLRGIDRLAPLLGVDGA